MAYTGSLESTVTTNTKAEKRSEPSARALRASIENFGRTRPIVWWIKKYLDNATHLPRNKRASFPKDRVEIVLPFQLRSLTFGLFGGAQPLSWQPTNRPRGRGGGHLPIR